MLIKRKDREARRSLAAALATPSNALDRRTFLRRSGVVAGGLAALGTLPLAGMRHAKAGPPAAPGAAVTMTKNICTHCSVGCTVIAEVSNGVWIGQEPGWDSPINRGSHCAKGASVRELVHGDRRLKYPMKLVNGQWTRISLGSGDQRDRRQAAGDPREVRPRCQSIGSARRNSPTKAPISIRKFAAFWGTNNVDHQARICHSTTVAGVANTWGYGAMTNSYNDIRNSKTMIIMGGNPAEAHPVSLQHLLEGKELQPGELHRHRSAHDAHGRACDRIRARASRHRYPDDLRACSGTSSRTAGRTRSSSSSASTAWRRSARKSTSGHPEEVERVTGVPGAQLKRVAEMFATQKPATLIWCMGQTQHTVGTANVRACCIALLATGNVGSFGTGANIFRGHCNVQGATDLGLDIVTLPLYYGLTEGAWKHWCRVWEVDYDWMLSRFDSTSR